MSSPPPPPPGAFGAAVALGGGSAKRQKKSQQQALVPRRKVVDDGRGCEEEVGDRKVPRTQLNTEDVPATAGAEGGRQMWLVKVPVSVCMDFDKIAISCWWCSLFPCSPLRMLLQCFEVVRSSGRSLCHMGGKKKVQDLATSSYLWYCTPFMLLLSTQCIAGTIRSE